MQHYESLYVTVAVMIYAILVNTHTDRQFCARNTISSASWAKEELSTCIRLGCNWQIRLVRFFYLLIDHVTVHGSYGNATWRCKQTCR